MRTIRTHATEHIVHRHRAQEEEHHVLMLDLGEKLRERAHELALSDAEVARRCNLSPRRYGHYVTGAREPDLQTLIRICKILNTTPNELLGFSQHKKKSSKDKLVEKLIATATILDESQLKLAVRQVEAMVEA